MGNVPSDDGGVAETPGINCAAVQPTASDDTAHSEIIAANSPGPATLSVGESAIVPVLSDDMVFGLLVIKLMASERIFFHIAHLFTAFLFTHDGEWEAECLQVLN